jgi:hypothetical protein
MGYFVTSAITTSLLASPEASHDFTDMIIPNTWCIAEWITLIGFACIGLEIDAGVFVRGGGDQHRKILSVYLVIQAFDIASTFGWSYLMFWSNNSEDDQLNDDNA